MLNRTNVTHPTFIKKLLVSCRKSMSQSVDHMRDNNGNAYLAVRYITTPNGKKGFHITDRKGENVATTLGRGLIIHAKNPQYSLVRFINNNVLYNFQMK